MKTCPGRESWRRRSFQTPGDTLTIGSMGSFGISEGNKTGRKKQINKTHRLQRLIITPSGEVAQTLTSATSKQGLNRETQAALLRVRTGPECPEDNLRELTWDSNPNCGIAREKNKKDRENFPAKSSNLRHCWAAHRTKDWANTRGEVAGCGLAHPPPEAERHVGGSQSQQGAILAPEMATSTKLWAGSQLLTKSSWDCGQLTSPRKVTVRDQLPRGDTWHTWDDAPAAHPGNWVAGTREVISHTAPPGESALTKHLVAWAAQTWEGHKTQAQLNLCPCGVSKNLNLRGLDLGSVCNPEHTLESSPAKQPGAWAV